MARLGNASNPSTKPHHRRNSVTMPKKHPIVPVALQQSTEHASQQTRKPVVI